MLNLIENNIATVIICIVLIFVISAVIFSMIRARKKGKGCGCGCSGCAMKDSCHKN